MIAQSAFFIFKKLIFFTFIYERSFNNMEKITSFMKMNIQIGLY